MSRRAALRQALQRRTARPAAWLLGSGLAQRLPARLERFLLGARVHDALARNDDRTALADLRALQLRHGRDELVHRLLFRRGFRPKDPASQRRLLWGIADEPCFSDRHGQYALISLSYRCLKDSDPEEAGRLIPRLQAIAAVLEHDPETLRCQGKNRVNRCKLLISAYATLLHLHLLRNEAAAVAEIGARGCGMAERIEYERLPPDVTYRLTTNFSRVLAIAWLDAWRRGDTAGRDRAMAGLDDLRREAWSERHRASGAQENHRRHVVAMIEALRELEDLPPRPGLPPPFPPERLLNVRTPLLERRLAAFLTP
jgi:hypothetical protein